MFFFSYLATSSGHKMQLIFDVLPMHSSRNTNNGYFGNDLLQHTWTY